MAQDANFPGSYPMRELKRAYPIYVVSGGTGATGDLLARTVLAQFREVQADIIVVPNVNTVAQIEDVAETATRTGGLIIHTLVNPELHNKMVACTEARAIFAVDLAQPLLGYLSQELGQEPIGVPGLYRQSQIAYFRRVEAIEFTVAHDDGKRTEDLRHADIVLVGASRSGKTPLSMYLSMMGWKVANVPIVPGVEPPEELLQCDKRRVVALQIDPQQLMAHRRWRQARLGVDEGYYVDRSSIVEELRDLNHFFVNSGFTLFDVTNKPIETSGEEIVNLVARRLTESRPVMAGQ